jgi:transposase-like protein
MAQTCSACIHRQRREIDAAVVDGVSVRDIAGRFGLSKTAVDRHKAHVAGRLRDAKSERDADAADDLATRMRQLVSRTEDILRRAIDDDEDDRALRAIDRLVKIADLELRVAERLSPKAGDMSDEELSSSLLKAVIALAGGDRRVVIAQLDDGKHEDH